MGNRQGSNKKKGSNKEGENESVSNNTTVKSVAVKNNLKPNPVAAPAANKKVVKTDRSSRKVNTANNVPKMILILIFSWMSVMNS
jgi:hypothetical protein